MKFLCLIRAEKVMEQMPKADADAHFDEYRRFTEEIRKNGHYVTCNRLVPSPAATTVRVRQGKISAIDGPYAEAKEQLGGYYVVEARDVREAIQLAAKIPAARVGSIEVRQVAEDEQTLRALGMLASEVMS